MGMQKYHLSITWEMQKRKVYTIKVAFLGTKRQMQITKILLQGEILFDV